MLGHPLTDPGVRISRTGLFRNTRFRTSSRDRGGSAHDLPWCDQLHPLRKCTEVGPPMALASTAPIEPFVERHQHLAVITSQPVLISLYPVVSIIPTKLRVQALEEVLLRQVTIGSHPLLEAFERLPMLLCRCAALQPVITPAAHFSPMLESQKIERPTVRRATSLRWPSLPAFAGARGASQVLVRPSPCMPCSYPTPTVPPEPCHSYGSFVMASNSLRLSPTASTI